MFIGGCAGSTACGIKIFRVQILFQFISVQLKKLFIQEVYLKLNMKIVILMKNFWHQLFHSYFYIL